MAKFKIEFNMKKLEKDLNKQISDIVKKEQKRLIIEKDKERGKMNILNKNAEEMLKVFLRKYDEIKDYCIDGSYDEFPERMRFSIKDTMESLELYDYISNYLLFINGGWSVTLTPEALEYFDKKGRRTELFEELVSSEKELLREILKIDNENGDVTNFLKDKVDNDLKDILRGIIGTLDSNGLIKVVWGSDTVYYATLTQAGRSYFEREQKYKEINPNVVYINGNQVNIAKDNAILTASQINNTSELDKLIEELKEILENNDIDESVKNEILDNVDGIKEELNRDKPRKGILKSFTEGLKQSINLVPKLMEIGANITAIITFLEPFIN